MIYFIKGLNTEEILMSGRGLVHITQDPFQVCNTLCWQHGLRVNNNLITDFLIIEVRIPLLPKNWKLLDIKIKHTTYNEAALCTHLTNPEKKEGPTEFYRHSAHCPTEWPPPPNKHEKGEPGNQLFIQSIWLPLLYTGYKTCHSGCNFDNQKYTVLNF